MWYLIVSILDLCLLSYFHISSCTKDEHNSSNRGFFFNSYPDNTLVLKVVLLFNYAAYIKVHFRLGFITEANTMNNPLEIDRTYTIRKQQTLFMESVHEN